MIEGYTTVKKIAEKWGLKPRTVQIMCADGKIPGAVKFGRDWAIPENSSRPIDGRVVNGEYRNSRNN
ncbi:MAG TPA: helix-turn-helix domain-containing protein [Candidatus Eisenbacteria bacterium]|nr:helix-turn-helix domain-containing protein [Candidatus Eisenbacteria bacterium]